MIRVRAAVWRIASLILDGGVAILFLASAPLWRADSSLRRRLRQRPRIVWGPTPILNIKYWSGSLRALGYRSTTLVGSVYPANERADFDLLTSDLGSFQGRLGRLNSYLAVVWVLRHADIVSCFYDGGFMAQTRLRRLELPLLRLAGKRIVVMPMGSDVAVPGHLGPWEQEFLADYPHVVDRADAIRERVVEFSRWADLAIRTPQPGFQPRWDVLWATALAVDTGLWAPRNRASSADGRNGPVVVVHAPNHRALKGTEALLAAVETLRSDGLDVRLDLVERRPNSEVREAVLSCDIVADQFICGYGLFAVEALAAGKPVLTNVRWLPAIVRDDSTLRDSPVVDTDRDDLADRLGELVRDPARRKELGEESRHYALLRYSYDAVGCCWAALFDHVWLGTALGDPFVVNPAYGSSTANPNPSRP